MNDRKGPKSSFCGIEQEERYVTSGIDVWFSAERDVLPCSVADK